MMRKRLLLATTLFVAAPLIAQQVPTALTADGTAHPDKWPQAASQGLVNPETEKRITAMMAGMTLEQKVGQMIQADITTIKPEDLRQYPLGSILAGGNSPPLGAPDDRSVQGDWVKTAQAFRAVAMEDRPGNAKIPLIFGVDAVHGNNNVIGATVFPHNIGLGAMRDPALIKRIGEVTAIETAASGPDWAFGPTLAVPQNDRWGRAYEGYSEDPAIVASYSGAMIEGLQGKPGEHGIQRGRVAASAKHFLGDGGTTDGIDQGNTQVDEDTLIRVHSAGYPGAINAGTMTVMASYSSWNGIKMHGNRSLLTDVLKTRMGFQGFVVGDWNGHGQIPGCTKDDCPQTFNAGLDMVMAPDSWKGMYDSTLKHVRDGTIPMARVDDAVRRILRVKFALGLFDPARPVEGTDQLGTPEHRAVARQAVRESLVLLKNDGVLPLKASANVLVAGDGADSFEMQTGGWTLTWQGQENPNNLFPKGQTIFGGIAEAVKAGGGSATLSADGSFKGRKPDVAIVVFGERPYAEMRGDIRTLEFQPGDKQALATLKKLRAQGIPVVSVFLSGRPLWVNPELNASNAFVAAWLPGTEGGGVADVIVGDAAGKPRTDFHGLLSYSWPRTAGQFVLNAGTQGYDPLFPLGYGLTYAKPGKVAKLSEAAGIDSSTANTSIFFARGQTPAPFSFGSDSGIARKVVEAQAQQEGAVQFSWPNHLASLRIGGAAPVNLTREANGDVAIQIIYRVDTAPKGPVTLMMEGGANGGGIDATSLFGTAGGWKTTKVFLRCFHDNGVDIERVTSPFVLKASGPFVVTFADIRFVADPNNSVCPGKK